MHTTDTMDDGAVFVIRIDPTADWHHSTFPEPLITVDHDAQDNVIQIVAVGSAARALAEATRHKLGELVGNTAEFAALEGALA